MSKYTQAELDAYIDRAIDRAMNRSLKRVAREAAEHAVALHEESLKHYFDLILESTGFIRDRLKDMVTRNEFNGLKSEVKIIRRTLTDTNKDLRSLQGKKPGWGSL